MIKKKVKTMAAIMMVIAMTLTALGQWGMLSVSHAAENYSDNYRLVMRGKTDLS